MVKACRLVLRQYGEYSDEERWYVVEVFLDYPAPPLHIDLVDSVFSKVRNDAPDWITQRCYYDGEMGIYYPEPPHILPPALPPPKPPGLPVMPLPASLFILVDKE